MVRACVCLSLTSGSHPHPMLLSAEIARLAERAQVAGGVDAGAITADMLEQALLSDLNRTSELGEITYPT